MVDVLKKVDVPKNILSEIDWETEGYIVRYRIVSESKNIRSHWSPTYIIPVSEFEDVVGDVSESPSGIDPESSVVTVVWDDLFDRPLYDVFVAFRGDEPEEVFEYDGDLFYYHGRTPTHSYSFINRPNAESIRVIIQPAANKFLIKDKFVIYDSDNPVVIES
jgi:hypothetical protein